jgi:ATP-dependent helicase/nuclease subunit A
MAGKLAYPYTEADAQAYAKEHGQNLDARDLEQFLSLNEDPLYKSWMSMPHTFEESYILQSDGQIAHGFMDLVVQAPNETIVLDFKTDFVKNMEELKVRYAKQLDMYRWAMSRLRPGKPVHTYVYSFTLKEMKSFAD